MKISKGVFKQFLTYFITVTILVILLLSTDSKQWDVLKNIGTVSIIYTVLIALVIYSTSGCQYYFIRKKYNITVEKKDIFLLPIVMNLWSFIIPFQGSLLYSTLFFKLRYKMKITDSFSMSIYMYLVTLFLTGIVGMIFSFSYNYYFSLIFIVSLALALNPLIIYIIYLFFKKLPVTKIKFFNKITDVIITIITNTKILWTDKKITLTMIFFNILRSVICMFWLYVISHACGFNCSLLSMALLSLIMDVSIIVRVTPENLGVVQLISALLSTYIGISRGQAIIITLLASASTVIIMLTVGIAANYYYMRLFNFHSFKGLVKEIMNKK